MLPRALLVAMIVMLASCVPPAGAVRQAAATDPAEIPVETLRQMPAVRVAQAIDTVTAPGHAAAPFEGATGGGRALDCLTAAVYYEARSEPLDGQRAVAQVVLNRVRHPAFPRSICGVVFQGRERRTGCQFSFTCDGSMNRGREPGAWARAREVAEAALAGYVYGPVGLATHFHTTAIHPWWASAMRRAVTVGAHVFYRWPGQWGDPMAFRQPYQGWEGGIPQNRIADTSARGGAETVMGVTIHRGGSAGSQDARAAQARLAVQYARAEQGGVRIHRGGSRGGGAPDVAVHAGVSGTDMAATSPADAGALTR